MQLHPQAHLPARRIGAPSAGRVGGRIGGPRRAEGGGRSRGRSGGRIDGRASDATRRGTVVHDEDVAVVDDRALERVVCRPIRPDDAERLVRMFPRLSSETLYRRFFSPVVEADLKRVGYLCDVDHDQREALVALVGDEVIGVARYDRDPDDPASAEVAVLVEDAWQGHGVATFLLRRLGLLAYERGITDFDADVLASNDAPVRLARTVAPAVEVTFVDGETHLGIPLDPATVDRAPWGAVPAPDPT